MAGIGFFQTCKLRKQGRLSAPGWPHNAEEIPLVDFQIDMGKNP